MSDNSELEMLKDQYVALLNEKDVLVNWGEPELRARYTATIGKLQLQRLKAQLLVKSLQLKIEKVTSAINRLQPVEVSVIECEVAAMLAEAEQQIMTESKKLEVSTNLLKNLATPEKSRALRKLYCAFAKKLHPDVSDALTPELSELWLMVNEGYEQGDLDRLESLMIVYEKELADADGERKSLQPDEVSGKVGKMKDGIKSLVADIAQIKSLFPFTMEKNIRDDQWVQQETKAIREDIDRLNAYERELSQHYHQLLSTT